MTEIVFNVMPLKGRIKKIEIVGKFFIHHVVCPAIDEYPELIDSFKVKSTKRIGAENEIIRWLCKVTGYIERPVEYTAKKTGEVKIGQFSKMYLEYLEPC